MNLIKLARNASLFCLSFLSILSAFAGGGGNDGGNGGELPSPNGCESNCGFELGPQPTPELLATTNGPELVSSFSVASSVDGFGGGTVYYPRNISQEMAAVAVVPGYLSPQSQIAWWGPFLASHGFVVITMDTNSRFDQPESRSRQLDNALNFLITESGRTSSQIAGLVDVTRLATVGYSMGGGGSLRAASRNKLSAAIGLVPWSEGPNNFDQIEVPTLIVACESDGIAPVNIHASPFYLAIPNSTDKAYLELSGGNHGCANIRTVENASVMTTYGLSWMKRFLDKDKRYDQFLCGPDHLANSRISEYRDTCDF